MSEKKDSREIRIYERSWQMEAAEQLLIFALPAMVAAYMCSAFSGDFSASWQAILVWLMSLWLLLVRSKFDNLLLFLGGNAAVYLIMLLIPGGEGNAALFYRVIYLVLLSAMVGYNFYKKFSNPITQESGTPTTLLMGMAGFALLFFGTGTFQLLYYREILVAVAMLFGLGYFFYMNRVKMDKTLYMLNQETMDQPIGKVKKNNTIMFLIVLAVLAVLMEISMLFPWDDTGSGGALALLFGRFFVWIVNTLDVTKLFKDGGEGEISFDSQVGESAGGGAEGGGPSTFAVLTEYFAYFCFVVGAIVLIIWAIRRFIIVFKSLGKKKFRKKEEFTGEEVEEIREFIVAEKKERVRREPLWNLTNEQKVRRMFRKRVRKYMGTKLQRSDSAENMNRKAPEAQLENLVPLYNQARYSDKPIGDTEVKDL